MRQFYPFLLVALAASWVRGEISAYGTQVLMGADYPICYDYQGMLNEEWTFVPATDASSTALLLGEVFRAFVVRDTRDESIRSTTPPCTLDFTGQIVPAEGLTAADFKWCTIKAVADTVQEEAYKTVSENKGVPCKMTDSTQRFHQFTVGCSERFDTSVTSEGNIFLYFVALDTRTFDTNTGAWSCSGKPERVVRYALRKGMEVGKPVKDYPLFDVTIGLNDEVLKDMSSQAVYGAYVLLPGLSFEDPGVGQPLDPGTIANEWCYTTLPKSLTVGGVTYEGEDLERYLSPVVTGFSTSAPTDGTLATTLSDSGDSVFYLSATSPDLALYALETTSTLTNPSWEGFNDFLERERNGLDSAAEMDYSRCRVDGTNPLMIPVIKVEGEKGRFYRLRLITP